MKKYGFDIQPCPFCRGEPEITTRQNSDQRGEWTTYYVECMVCRVCVPAFDGALTREGAVERWNLRGQQGHDWYNRGAE